MARVQKDSPDVNLWERLYVQYVSTHTKEDQVENPQVRSFGIMKLMPANPNAQVLDLGCGSGEFLLQLKKKGFKSVSGVDISEEQLALARIRGIRDVHTDDVKSFLCHRKDTYDVITANDFLEHLDKKEVLEVLDLIYHSLRPGGFFLAQTPNGASPLYGTYFFGDYTHLTVFSVGSIKQICSSLNFIDVKVVPVPPTIRSPKSFIRAVAWKLASFCIKFALAADTGRTKDHVVTSNLAFSAVKPVAPTQFDSSSRVSHDN